MNKLSKIYLFQFLKIVGWSRISFVSYTTVLLTYIAPTDEQSQKDILH